jgi:UDP-glucuronate 4-epimerase
MRVLITGSAGFIGMHTAKQLLSANHSVIGIDNHNNYYDRMLKQHRVDEIKDTYDQYIHIKADIADYETIRIVFETHKPEYVIHLAAQAGVRYGSVNPQSYGRSNLDGFLNILEACRHYAIKHLIFASSSSVYGANEKLPYTETDSTDHPLSLYAATKKANEVMAHSYAAMYNLPTTGLRFFTVYGSWGRPDMAPMIFTKALSEGKEIRLFNYGNHSRSFTHVSDIVKAICGLLTTIPEKMSGWDAANPTPNASFAPYRVYNIGSSRTCTLREFVSALEDVMSTTAIIGEAERQSGDVLNTAADSSRLREVLGISTETSLKAGLRELVSWYDKYSKGAE